MSILEKYAALPNPLMYYRLAVPAFHRELFGSSKPRNEFELMHLVGSEKGQDNFQKVKIDSHYLAYIPLKKFNINAPLKITQLGASKYPWYSLVVSIKKEGFKSPLIVRMLDNGSLLTVEGKHRLAASGMMEPFNPDFKLPSLLIVLDMAYTIKMFKKKHPYPFNESGFKIFGAK